MSKLTCLSDETLLAMRLHSRKQDLERALATYNVVASLTGKKQLTLQTTTKLAEAAEALMLRLKVTDMDAGAVKAFYELDQLLRGVKA